MPRRMKDDEYQYRKDMQNPQSCVRRLTTCFTQLFMIFVVITVCSVLLKACAG
jgi:hypothetical protein